MNDFSPELRKAFRDFYEPHADAEASDAIGMWVMTAVFAYLVVENLWRGNGFAAACLLAPTAGFGLWGWSSWREYRRTQEKMREFE